MSDDDKDIDIESDDDNDSDSGRMQQRNAGIAQNFTQAEKRAHHNALERKRRDHIKDSFTCLREAVPSLQGEKVASRAQILKKTAECIQMMRRKIQSHQKDVEDIKKQNAILEAQIRLLENARDAGYPSPNASKSHIKQEQCSDSSDGEEHDFRRRNKKLKTSYQA